jgi:hypothetical protein
MLFSNDATFRVRDGGAMPSFFDARMKLPSWAMTTISMLTSNGFLFCMRPALDGQTAPFDLENYGGTAKVQCPKRSSSLICG